MELTQDATVQMGMRVSPRLVAASYILELSSQELQQAIAQEISENPAMELVEKETCPACGGPMQGSICPACLSQQKLSPTRAPKWRSWRAASRSSKPTREGSRSPDPR